MRFITVPIIIIINFILQSTVFQYLEVNGIIPNTALGIIVCIAIIRGGKIGGICGLIAGILTDLMYSDVLGINALLLFLIGYIVGLLFDENFELNTLFVFLVMVVSTISWHIAYYIMNYLFIVNIEASHLFKKIIITECIYNGLIAVLMYKFMTWIYRYQNNDYMYRNR